MENTSAKKRRLNNKSTLNDSSTQLFSNQLTLNDENNSDPIRTSNTNADKNVSVSQENQHNPSTSTGNLNLSETRNALQCDLRGSESANVDTDLDNTSKAIENIRKEEPECMVIDVSPNDVEFSSNEQVTKKKSRKSTKKTKKPLDIPANQKRISDFYKTVKTCQQGTSDQDKYRGSRLNNYLSTTTDQETNDRSKLSGTNADENFSDEPFEMPNTGSIDLFDDISDVNENDSVSKSLEYLENSDTCATSFRNPSLENLENFRTSATSYRNYAQENLENSGASATSYRNSSQENNENLSNRNTRIPEDTIQSFLHIVGRYLKTCDQFKELLTEESKKILSTVATKPDIKKIISHLYWEGEIPLDLICKNNSISNWEEIKDELYQNGIIIQDLAESNNAGIEPDHGNDNDTIECYTKRLDYAHLCEIRESLNLPKPSKKNNVYDIFKNCCEKTSLENWLSCNKNREVKVIQRLKSKYKECYYKLSKLARNTFEDLYILMNLNNYICPSKKGKENKYEISTEIFKNPYPIAKDMTVENANIVFRNREEFVGYREACLFYEKWENANTDQKPEVTVEAYNLFKKMGKESEPRYLSLPPWLRQFTPAYIYVDILDKSVKDEKTNKSDILDLLIAQVAFKQEKRYTWYNEMMKTLIGEKKFLMAAETLLKAYDVLSEEAAGILLNRAKCLKDNEKHVPRDLRKKIGYYMEKYKPKLNIDPDRIDAMRKGNEGKTRKYFKLDTGKTVTVEDYCGNEYIKRNEGFTMFMNCEGKIVCAMYFALFWDIIYTKPVGVLGVYISNYQIYPLDMFSEDFYNNRKSLIDNRIAIIQKSKEKILELMEKHLHNIYDYNIPQKLPDDITKEVIMSVVIGLKPREVAAICYKLARNYGYARTGFPDLTLYSHNIPGKVAFVEVKLDKDRIFTKQKQWRTYLEENGIDVRVCYVNSKTQGVGVLEDKQEKKSL